MIKQIALISGPCLDLSSVHKRSQATARIGTKTGAYSLNLQAHNVWGGEKASQPSKATCTTLLLKVTKASQNHITARTQLNSDNTQTWRYEKAKLSLWLTQFPEVLKTKSRQDKLVAPEYELDYCSTFRYKQIHFTRVRFLTEIIPDEKCIQNFRLYCVVSHKTVIFIPDVKTWNLTDKELSKNT